MTHQHKIQSINFFFSDFMYNIQSFHLFPESKLTNTKIELIYSIESQSRIDKIQSFRYSKQPTF